MADKKQNGKTIKEETMATKISILDLEKLEKKYA